LSQTQKQRNLSYAGQNARIFNVTVSFKTVVFQAKKGFFKHKQYKIFRSTIFGHGIHF
jgi:hypothetical protein